MIIAGFDLATVSGFAVLDGARVVTALPFRAVGEDDGEIFNSFRYKFRDFLQDHEVREAAFEQPLRTNLKLPAKHEDALPDETFNPVNMKTFLRLYGLRAHALEVCRSLRIPYQEVNQMTWRKAFTGNARATKEDSLAIAQQLLPGLTSKDAAEAIGVAWWLNGQIKQRALVRGKVA
jgi:Holliday junction resolvasome RuvABC endonuclease subunit